MQRRIHDVGMDDEQGERISYGKCCGRYGNARCNRWILWSLLMRWSLLSIVMIEWCCPNTCSTWALVPGYQSMTIPCRGFQKSCRVHSLNQATSSQSVHLIPSSHLSTQAKPKRNGPTKANKTKTVSTIKGSVKKTLSKEGKTVKESLTSTSVSPSVKAKISKKAKPSVDAVKGKKATTASKAIHWQNTTDPVHLEPSQNKHHSNVLYNDTVMFQKIHWIVRGNPLPLRRHRTSRGFVYNPSAPAQDSFRNITMQILKEGAPVSFLGKSDVLAATTAAKTTNDTSSTNSVPLFASEQALTMTIVFRMKRPNLHFIGNKRGISRLRDTAPDALSPTRTDVDNLAKFVLDSLNGILYEDDRQIHSLQLIKMLDTDGLCEGSTEIVCRPLTGSDLSSLLNIGD